MITRLIKDQGFKSAVSDSKAHVFPAVLLWLLNQSQSEELSSIETEGDWV